MRQRQAARVLLFLSGKSEDTDQVDGVEESIRSLNKYSAGSHSARQRPGHSSKPQRGTQPSLGREEAMCVLRWCEGGNGTGKKGPKREVVEVFEQRNYELQLVARGRPQKVSWFALHSQPPAP